MNIGFPDHKVIDHGFFRDHGLDFATRGVLGRAVRGASEVGEVLATIARVKNQADWSTAVSYTHLTLPTTPYV